MGRAAVVRSKRKFPACENRRGAMMLLMLVVLIGLLSVGALAINATWLASHKLELRSACQAAALAAAGELLDPNAGATTDATAAARVTAATNQAKKFFALNSSVTLRTTGSSASSSDLLARWCASPTTPGGTSTTWSGVGPVNAFAVRGARRRNVGEAVTVWFGGLFGVQTAEPAAAAMASMDQRIYGFAPVKDDLVAAPVVPLLTYASITWPSGGTGSLGQFSDAYTVDTRVGTVGTGPDGIGEITIHVALAGNTTTDMATSHWMSLMASTSTGTTSFTAVAAQITDGLESYDLVQFGGQFALAADGALPVPLAAAPTETEANMLVLALNEIAGKKRVWPLGIVSVNSNSQASCIVTGFVAGAVVGCSRNGSMLDIVVQGCTFQTCTGLLRNGMARNPWIGKLILNE